MICWRFSTPIRKMSVSGPLARPAQRIAVSGLVGSSWPVTTANEDATCRCVTGIPAKLGPAMADVMPGTTSNGTPTDPSAMASSPPRPKTYGSPPFSRTTTLPASPRSTSRALISSWLIVCWRGPLPTKIRSADSGAWASRSGEARRS